MARCAAKLPDCVAPLISSRRIERRLKGLAKEIQGAIPLRERPIAIVVLQGAFIFAADLLRRLRSDYPIEIAFLRCESYGPNTHSSGRVLLLQDIDPGLDLHGRTVLLIDDILDTGLTLRYLVAHLRKRGAARVRVCVLLQRNSAPKSLRLKADFCGFDVGPEFVVGYGLDHDGRYRHLPYLAALKPRRGK